MNKSVHVPRTTRWGFVTAGAVIALCTVPVSGLSVSAVGSAEPGAPKTSAGHAGSSNLSGGKWGDPTADSLSKDAYGKNQAERVLALVDREPPRQVAGAVDPGRHAGEGRGLEDGAHWAANEGQAAEKGRAA